MTGKNRKGFTLVELLVVIVIISMLAGLLIPALVGARARARRTQCGNNQRELSLAFQQYESATQHLPGYVNRFPAAQAATNFQNFSWPVLLLEHLGRSDLWEKWRDLDIPLADKTDPTSVDFLGVTLNVLTCPADSEAGEGGLSYVVNCGLDDAWSFQTPAPSPFPDPPDTLANGMFHDRATSGVTHLTRNTERIPDGAGQTLLLSENLQAGRWYDGCEATPTDVEANIGMVWVPATDTDGDGQVNELPDPPSGWYRINEDLEASGGDIEHARPSSHHSGGVVVSYCDGHQGFLDEGVDYNVYRSQMVPDDARSDYFLQ